MRDIETITHDIETKQQAVDEIEKQINELNAEVQEMRTKNAETVERSMKKRHKPKSIQSQRSMIISKSEELEELKLVHQNLLGKLEELQNEVHLSQCYDKILQYREAEASDQKLFDAVRSMTHDMNQLITKFKDTVDQLASSETGKLMNAFLESLRDKEKLESWQNDREAQIRDVYNFVEVRNRLRSQYLCCLPSMFNDGEFNEPDELTNNEFISTLQQKFSSQLGNRWPALDVETLLNSCNRFESMCRSISGVRPDFTIVISASEKGFEEIHATAGIIHNPATDPIRIRDRKREFERKQTHNRRKREREENFFRNKTIRTT